MTITKVDSKSRGKLEHLTFSSNWLW